jgi:hypothetical protein
MNCIKLGTFISLLAVFALANLQAAVAPATIEGSKNSAIYNYFSSITKSAGDAASNLWESAQRKAKAGKDLVKGTQAYNYTVDALDSLQQNIKKNLSGLSPLVTPEVLKGAGYGLAGGAALTGLLTVLGTGIAASIPGAGPVLTIGSLMHGTGGIPGRLAADIGKIAVPVGVALGALWSSYDLLGKAKDEAAAGKLSDAEAQVVINEVNNLVDTVLPE